MILTRRQAALVEGHLYGHDDDKAALADLELTIIEAARHPYDGTGRHGSQRADPTAQAAARLERETQTLRGWVTAVQRTRDRYEGTQAGQAMHALYTQRKRPQRAAIDLYIGQTTIYRMREDIITFCAMQAAMQGVFTL